MKKSILYLCLFIIWTLFVIYVDVKPLGVCGSSIGLSTINLWIHQSIDVHMFLYHITDWLGLAPIFICAFFGFLGLFQLIQRKKLSKVDADVILLGIYYILVILCYLVFEKIPINYRPILINGNMEVSYPSSTTLLVLSVMLTFNFQINKRLTNIKIKKVILVMANMYTYLMIICRLISGVHWFSDIIGSILFSMALFSLYKAFVHYFSKGD